MLVRIENSYVVGMRGAHGLGKWIWATLVYRERIQSEFFFLILFLNVPS